MASFIEELWNSIFTPGPTPTLLIATNASFAALQLLLLVLLYATYSIHFVVLSILTAALWYAINWFAREIQAEKAKTEGQTELTTRKERSLELESDTETEAPLPAKRKPKPAPAAPAAPPVPVPTASVSSTTHLRPAQSNASDDALRRRRSLGDSSGYISTDSEWEKISEGDEKGK